VFQQSISKVQDSIQQINKQGQRRDPWTEQELQWLKDNYNKGSMDWLCQELGRTQKGIEQKLFKQRLSKSGRKLKEILTSPKIQVKTIPERKQDFICELPVFGEVMIGIYPSAIIKKPRVWKQRRAIILKMHDEQCFWCGDLATSVDHLKPRHDGGIDSLDNLVAACHRCNSAHAGRVKTWVDWTPKLSTPVDKYAK
jgi:hypothetical protein